MRNILVLLTALIFGFARPVSASTTLGGGNIINQNWTVAGSPYIVQGDITIPSGSTLTIAAGTVIQFAATDAQASGLDAHRIELTVNGALDIEGTDAAPVQFAGQTSSNPDIWFGIVVNAAATSAIIKHADIANAYFGIYSVSGHVLSASALAIHDCQTGMFLVGGPTTFDRLTITGSVYNGIDSQGASGTISNALIQGNNTDGVSDELGAGAELLIINSTIYGNSYDGVAVGPARIVTIRNSIIAHNGTGVACHNSNGCAFASVSYSDVVDNAADYLNVVAGTGSISQTPNFVAAPNNLALKYPSAGIDAGSSVNAPDHDLLGRPRPINATGAAVAEYDMGAYETADDVFANGFD